MSTRVATMEDLPRILDLGELLHKESPRWSRMSFNRAKAAEYIANLIIQPNGVVFLAEREGQVVGGIAGMVTEHWCSDDLLGYEVSLFMDAGARGTMAPARLICALEAWCGMRGALWTTAGTSTGLDPERTAGLYETLGWSRCMIGLEKQHGN